MKATRFQTIETREENKLLGRESFGKILRTPREGGEKNRKRRPTGIKVGRRHVKSTDCASHVFRTQQKKDPQRNQAEENNTGENTGGGCRAFVLLLSFRKK